VTHKNTHISGLLVLAATAWIGSAPLAMAQDDLTVRNNYGTEVVNVATLTQTINGRTSAVATNAAVFVIQPPQTPATIEFFRHAPTANDPIIRAINGSDFSPSGNTVGPFSSIGPSVTAGGNTVNLSSPIPLIPASTYLAGELMFVRVTDEGQNLDSNAVDTVVITITASNGDVITLRLYESGPDTGEFFAYLPSTPVDSDKNDSVISAGGNTQLTATYIDTLDQTDVVVDTAILNPLNRVFSSVDGESIDAAVVTLINVDTGERAVVFGVDGFSSFPSEVISGTDATDTGGLVYDNNDGEFRFPIVQPGKIGRPSDGGCRRLYQLYCDPTLITFDMANLAPGETLTLDYALLVGPAAHMGDAVNEAVVRDATFDPISNTARASVTLREDLLRSTSTIIGRVTEQSCDGDADWARPIERGIGVDGVRLYMETGAYVVTDADGLFHLLRARRRFQISPS